MLSLSEPWAEQRFISNRVRARPGSFVDVAAWRLSVATPLAKIVRVCSDVLLRWRDW